MKFHLFDRHLEAHVRRSLEYLKEANLAQVEHQAAAEHHTALAKMYTTRIARIEAELNNTVQPRSLVTRQRLGPVGQEGEFPKAESVVAYPSRAARP